MYCFVLYFESNTLRHLSPSNMPLAIPRYINKHHVACVNVSSVFYKCFVEYFKSVRKSCHIIPFTRVLFSTPQLVHFFLPQNATVEQQSSCGKDNTSHPVLVLGFGAGHSLSLNFSEYSDKYQVEELVFHYNLSDATLFHNSTTGKMKTSCSHCVTLPDVILVCFCKYCYVLMQCNLFTAGVKKVSHKNIIQAYMGTKYRCISSKQINMKNVNVTFSNVTLEAYLTNGTFSTNSKYLVAENVLGELIFPIIDLFLFKSSLMFRQVQTESEVLIAASFEMNGPTSGFLCRGVSFHD